MTEQFELRMNLNGDQVDFTAFGRNLAAGGQPLQSRQKPPLDTELVERLRQGDAQLGLITTASQLVSSWMLGVDLGHLLDTAVNNLGEEKLRVIFHIDDRLRKHPELGDVLADLPFELLVLGGDIVPLVLSPRIAAFIHRLNKVPSASSSPVTRAAPLRVLIVHANPLSLGGQVPSPAHLLERIVELGAEIGPSMIQLDILSREEGLGAVGLPTSDGLWNTLRRGSYDILVFLGHGGREQVRDDVLPLSLLYLESEDGSQSEAVRADVLATELHNNPVPVVLLVGCLTAAEVPTAIRDDVLGAMPVAMRGNQGMAQALVNSSSGVQVAVGMRYRLESDDALDFLIEFFESLLQTAPGNVDASIHAGREKLHAANRFPGAYSAPVVYRVVSEEPMFGFLAAPPQVVVDPVFQTARSLFWSQLAGLSIANLAVVNSLRDVLCRLETELVQKMGEHGALLVPEWRLGSPGEAVEVPIKLHGAVNVDELEGNLVVDGPDTVITNLAASGSIQDSYLVLSAQDGNQAFFRIQRKPASSNPLPEGEVMTVRLQLGASAGVLYPMNIDLSRVVPRVPLSPVNSVVIVPAQ
jgi:hypothetical protein